MHTVVTQKDNNTIHIKTFLPKWKDKLSPALFSLAEHFERHGHTLYAVGGCIRDMFLGITIKDIDCTTNASPIQMMSFCKKTFPTGIKHGTITILWHGESFEVTTHRTENTYSNARHPDEVIFNTTIEQDLERRDISINAMAININTGILYDLFNGKEDIKNKIIRCVGNAQTRLTEDALRVLRVLRFSTKLDFTIEQKTYEALLLCAPNIIKISKERINEELRKMILHNPYRALQLLYESNIYAHVFTKELSLHIQKNYKYILLIFEYINTNTSSDFSKLDTDNKEIILFSILCISDNSNMSESLKQARIAKECFAQLRLRKKIIEKIHILVRHSHIQVYPNHTFHEKKCSKRLRILVQLVGIDIVFLKLIIHRIKSKHRNRNIDNNNIIKDIQSTFTKIQSTHYVQNAKDLCIDGNTLCSIKNLSPGRWLKYFQQSLIRYVVIHPAKNNQDSLIQYAKNLRVIKR